jgi:hypothetical protein
MGLRKMAKKLLPKEARLIREIHRSLGKSDTCLMLMGRNDCFALRSMNRIGKLCDVEFKVYSQWGEDGIIEWLLQRIPVSSNRFIEFGVENYSEANTIFLLKNRNWSGLVIDSNEEYVDALRKGEIYWKYDLTAVSAFINRDNIDSILVANGFSGRVGILSIDIDGNDYWVWDSIKSADPDIVICEYNAVFGDLYPIAVPYAEEFSRMSAHRSGLYYGAGIKAIELLATRKGYSLLGSNSAGNNVFFVKNEFCRLVSDAIESKKGLPSVFRESRDHRGILSFLRGEERFREIEDMPVMRVDTGEIVKLNSLGKIYSDEWLSRIG